MSNAEITFTKTVNIQALANSINLGDITESVTSTTYTVSDPSSGVTLELTGTGFASENLFGYTVLSAGTVTGFTFSLKGVTFAIGTGYSVPASTIDNTIINSVFAGNASPILALWFSFPVDLTGTAAEISKNLAFLAQYTDIASVNIKGTDLLTVNVAEFKKDQTLLNVVTEGFAVSDTEANVAAGLAKLLPDVSHIKSISLTDGATAALKLTTGQVTKYDSVIALLTGDYILKSVAVSGAVTTTGHGNDLQIADIAGKDTITGGGSNEDITFGASFGAATLTDFSKYQTSANHDTVTLASSEFTSGGASLLADAKPAGGNIRITAGTDVLMIDKMNMTELTTAVNDGYFKFV